MKNKAKSEEHKEYTGWWLQLAERYFDATITPDEEKALTQFLATKESDIPEFDEIKAVMGFIAAGRRINGNKKQSRRLRFTRWAAAASIALLAIAGITLKNGIASHEEEKEIYLALIDGKEYTFEGTVEGTITHEERGEGGFGYDPLFYFPQFGKTFAEVTPEEKHSVSHRGIAMRAFAKKLKEDI